MTSPLKPIKVDIYFQVKSINEINLNEEYMDVSVVITMEWTDKNLKWETGKVSTEKKYTPTQYTPTQYTYGSKQLHKKNGDDFKVININSIRADKSQVWVPEIEILNRVNDFSSKDEKKRQLKINSDGKVRYTR